MTAPVVTPVEPSKNKTWLVTAASVVGLLIAGLTWVAPVLPEKFSAIAVVAIAVLTPIGAYLAKYKESDEVIVKKADVAIAPAPSVSDVGDVPPPTPGLGGRRSSWG